VHCRNRHSFFDSFSQNTILRYYSVLFYAQPSTVRRLVLQRAWMLSASSLEVLGPDWVLSFFMLVLSLFSWLCFRFGCCYFILFGCSWTKCALWRHWTILSTFPAVLFYNYEAGTISFAKTTPDIVQTSISIILIFELLKTVRWYQQWGNVSKRFWVQVKTLTFFHF